jgi:hypothetical protein
MGDVEVVRGGMARRKAPVDGALQREGSRAALVPGRWLASAGEGSEDRCARQGQRAWNCLSGSPLR